jgi:hypothetical protein
VDLRVRLAVVGLERVVVAAGREPVGAGTADEQVVAVPAREPVAAGVAVDEVGGLVGEDDVVAGVAVDQVGIAGADELVVSVAARDRERSEEVEPGTALAAAVDEVVAAESVDLERKDAGVEGDVQVAVRVDRHAVLAGRDDVVPWVP